MSARVAMLRMHGVIVLPPPRQTPTVRPCPAPRPTGPCSRSPNVSPMSSPSPRSLSGTQAKAASGTSSSLATIILATPRCPARKCDTSSGPLAANPSPSSASAPRPGRSRPGTSSWNPETRRRTAGGQQCPVPALGSDKKPRVPSLWSNDGCRTTGSTATLRSCSRPSARRRASKEAATGPPARSAKHRAGARPGKNALSRSRTLKPLRRDWKRSLNK